MGRQRWVGAAIACVLALAVSAPLGARAAGGPMALAVHAGAGLTLSVIGGSTAVRFDAPASLEMQTFALPLPDARVSDTRGTGRGWHVTLEAAPVAGSDGVIPPAGSLRLTALAVICAAGTGCRGRSAPPGVRRIFPAAVDGSSATTLLSAVPRTGMGSYILRNGTLMLSIPAGGASRTYRSSLVISVASGP